ncbi:MAG: hypothetical protein JWO87_2750, partial [Phycisphaerales bacterium]|nr:hypothetical protein [Phycisphaerales bacterium]
VRAEVGEDKRNTNAEPTTLNAEQKDGPSLPEYNGLGEPGPLVHAVEQVSGYEDEVIASLGRVPNYYGVWMLGRILDSDTTPEQRARVLALLHKLAGSDDVPDSIRALARETYEFRE